MSVRHEPFFLADIVHPLTQNKITGLFTDPETVLRANTPEDIQPVLKKIDEYSKKGKYLAGYISYEAGCIMAGLKVRDLPESPLIWFGVFSKPAPYEFLTSRGDYYFSALKEGIGNDEYAKAFHMIKSCISNGIVYQINYTFPLKFQLFGDTESFFYDLKVNQNSQYNFMIGFENQNILSLSPELFFYKNSDRIWVKPMKGTAGRSADKKEDRENRQNLLTSSKNRAENAMITDILRNDLGKICSNGTVNVDRFLDIEEYPTLYQMTSTVTGILEKDASYEKIFKALLPCASVTGAPKLEAIKQIRVLERENRGVYTGAIGMIYPDGEAVFNVAIRTMRLRNHNGILNVGGGIVHDSDLHKEHEEALLKSNFTRVLQKPFYLFETMLLRNGKIRLCSLHLDRMRKSSKYFQFNFPEKDILTEFEKLKKRFTGSHRVKLTLNPEGAFSITSEPVSIVKKIYKIRISKYQVSPENEFIYHKTSFRDTYDNEYKDALKNNFDEVLFVNNNGMVTECSIHNIIAKINSRWITPERSSGLLPGTLRQYLLDRSFLVEAPLMLKDILQAESVAVINSLRGINKAKIYSEP
ncbi:MAG: chorismate-binding protein [Spirochaetia bacterium]|nr:chorismate-binding protein [Spirochaetia bacterium]